VRFIDDGNGESASKVAAGLVNPTTGTRPRSSWRSNVLLPHALKAYGDLEQSTGVKALTERVIRRVFRTPDDERLWRLAADRGVGVQWTPIEAGTLEGVPLPYGGVEYVGAVVDTNATLMVLEALDGITTEKQHVESLHPDPGSLVVWCNGWVASQHPLWSWLPFQPVKGEILDAQISGPVLTSVFLRSIWVIPTAGGSGTAGMQNVRIGSTHEWEDLTPKPTNAAKDSLVETARILLGRDMVVTGHRAAIRPAMQNKRPVLGRHPEHPEHFILNGLGSKGALWAPWAALQLADHIVEGLPLDPEVHTMRFWKT
jgi:glycine/D-amino acid oxidase-like deaminating enzyme